MLEKSADKNQIQLVFIQPGNPQQNAYIERYNRTVRYDWLNQYLFESIAEVQLHATQWLWTYVRILLLGEFLQRKNWH